MAICKGDSLFGDRGKYIKFLNGDIVAVDGMNIFERLLTNDLRMPYKQLMKSRVILKPGQVNYLMNHLGLGDNATFLAIRARYNQKSVNEEDNYVVWNYFDDFSKKYAMGQVMILTGNSTNRIKQLYLTNPNSKYPVEIDIMVASIDDEYNFFPDTVNQVGLSFINLTLFSIETHVPNESIVIWDNNVPRNPLAYIQLNNINSIERIGKLLIIDDTSVGKLFLDFGIESDAKQANSIINYVINNVGVIIQDLDPRGDNESPIVYFLEYVDGDPFKSIILKDGSDIGSPFNTGTQSNVFSATMSLSDYDSVITKSQILDSLIDYVEDNRDGILNINQNNIILYNTNQNPITSIVSSGTYSFIFLIEDIAGNSVNPNIEFNLYVL